MNPNYNDQHQSAFLEYWRNLAYNGGKSSSVYRVAKNSKFFVRRMGVKEEITGHNGCVNTVHWNKEGTMLLTGSDDRFLNLYSYPNYRLMEKIGSGHKANIFNAKFIPHSNDTKICSCSGDGIIHYNNLRDKKNYGKNPFKCHVGIVYDVITHNQDPHGFISCGEDGTVRYYDLRTGQSCNCLHCNKHILIDVGQAVTACTLNPMNPNEIVIGCDDGTIRAYDRRYRFTQQTQKISQISNVSSPSSPSNSKPNGIIYAYRPSQSYLNNIPGSHFNNRLTSLTFNWRGDELLASYCPSLLTLISTVPKTNITAAEITETRTNLFGDSSLVPGDSKSLYDGKYSKKLIPFSEQSLSSPTSNNSKSSTQNKPSNNNHHYTSSMGMIPTSTTSNDSDQIAISNDPTNTEDNDFVNFPFIPTEYDSIAITSTHAEDSGEYSPIVFVSDDHHLFEDPIDEHDLNNSNDDIANYSHQSEMITPNFSNDHNSDDVDEALSRSQIDDMNQSTIFEQTSHGISNNVSGGEHSSRTVPILLRNDGNRNFMLRSVANTSRRHHNFFSTSNIDAIQYNRRSRNNNNSHHEYESSNASRDNSDNFISNTNPIEIALDSNGNSNDFKELASTSDSKTSGCKNGHTKSNIPSKETITSINDNNTFVDYNPYYFNTVDSLTNIGEYDRLRLYLDNIFVPKYAYTYRGHHNSRTMIKECNYYGDDFVMSGSDDGNVFIWDKLSGLIVNVFNADNNVVNCLQPHPIDPVIACSGIDSSIKIIAPIKTQAIPTSDINAIISSNEREMRGASNYYFDATPTMIFHVLLALERIQRNRGDDNSPSMDTPYTDPDRSLDDLLIGRDTVARRARESLRHFGRARPTRGWRRASRNTSEVDNDTNETSYHTAIMGDGNEDQPITTIEHNDNTHDMNQDSTSSSDSN